MVWWFRKNRYVSFAFDDPNFENYDFVDIWTKHNDDKYLIDTIAGVYFGKNEKDIDDCYKQQKIIADQLLEIFTTADKIGPTKLNHSSDPNNKSTYTDIYLDISDEYEVVIACYDWSEEALEKENKADHIYVSIRSKELREWLP